MKRLIRVHEYRHDEGQTCVCTTQTGNLVTLWDELPRSEVVRLQGGGQSETCSTMYGVVRRVVPLQITLEVAKPTVLCRTDLSKKQ